MCATSSYFSNWPKNVFLANFWNTSIFNSCNQHFSYNGCTENHQTLHGDAQYYVDVQRLGFFQIGSKMYFCDFFSKIWKIFFFIFAKSLFSVLLIPFRGIIVLSWSCCLCRWRCCECKSVNLWFFRRNVI